MDQQVKLHDVNGVKKLTEELSDTVKKVMSDKENFENFLKKMSQLVVNNNLSLKDCLFVFSKNSDAIQVMDAGDWEDSGYKVEPGIEGVQTLRLVMAPENLTEQIKLNLNEQFSHNPYLQQASYRLGDSRMEFTMDGQSHIGLKIDGKEYIRFKSEPEFKNFVDELIVDMIPTHYEPVTVYDIKDVVPQKPGHALYVDNTNYTVIAEKLYSDMIDHYKEFDFLKTREKLELKDMYEFLGDIRNDFASSFNKLKVELEKDGINRHLPGCLDPSWITEMSLEKKQRNENNNSKLSEITKEPSSQAKTGKNNHIHGE